MVALSPPTYILSGSAPYRCSESLSSFHLFHNNDSTFRTLPARLHTQVPSLVYIYLSSHT